MIELSDELLMAYVDGQLDKPQATVVSHLLRDDADLIRRTGRLQQTQARLLDTFGALLREGPVTASAHPRGTGGARNAPRGASGRGGGFLTAGMMGMLLLLGAAAGVTFTYYSGLSPAPPPRVEETALQMPPSNWAEDMAELHAFFTTDTVAVSPDSQTNAEVVKFQLAKLSNSLTLPDFSANGLKFTRGQLMSYRGSKLMQLIYTSKTEPLVAVYISVGQGETPVLPGQFGDVKTVSWSARGLRFVIAADMTHEALRALAATTQAQLGKL
jgi:anti-sigma factor RsiW